MSFKKKSYTPLRRRIGEYRVPALPGFCVSDLFVADTSDNARVKLESIYANFPEEFGSMVVAPHPGSALFCYELRHKVEDRNVVEAVGGVDKAFISLAEVYWLLEQGLIGTGERTQGAMVRWTDNLYIKNSAGQQFNVHFFFGEKAPCISSKPFNRYICMGKNRVWVRR
ncbi:MAG: hypothetical protein UT02_C0021G0015 [Parcubacteria group bacterium GW2011_GWC2_38_7]|nr:MAG: hypothetical protein UT02_C0021G0015 [Parcubacteria group bacterium GW2011_GWC2_38_7]